MQSRVLGDNRLSGRTTKMLAAAMRHCYDGSPCFVVLPKGLWDYCVPILRDLGASYIGQAPRVADFGKGSRIQFITIDNTMVNRNELSLRGIREEHVFWDHEAVRQIYNRAIGKYHEYD